MSASDGRPTAVPCARNVRYRPVGLERAHRRRVGRCDRVEGVMAPDAHPVQHHQDDRTLRPRKPRIQRQVFTLRGHAASLPKRSDAGPGGTQFGWQPAPRCVDT